MPKADEETEALRKELQGLADKCRDEQKKACDSASMAEGSSSIPRNKILTRKVLKGHINKVTCCNFSGDSRHCVSGSLDGKLIVWDCWTGNKTMIIPLRSAWVMTSVFSPSGNLVGCGGMDNMLTVYDINNRDANTGTAKIVREYLGYEGFLSSCGFLSDEKVITGSGDMAIMEWDVQSGKKILQLSGHNGDVAALSLKPQDENVFVTASVDRTIRLWDLREKQCQQIFWGHGADVNSVKFHANGNNFVTCSEDKTCRLWDLRADQEVTSYKPRTPNSSFTSCGLSVSGRLVFCSSDDSTIHYWDLLAGEQLGNLSGHDNRITQISVAPSGIGIASASWDFAVRCWGM